MRDTDLDHLKKATAVLAACVVQTLDESDPSFERRFLERLERAYRDGKEPDARSPWRDKLPPLPEPRPAKGEARKGKAHGGPPESSEA